MMFAIIFVFEVVNSSENQNSTVASVLGNVLAFISKSSTIVGFYPYTPINVKSKKSTSDIMLKGVLFQTDDYKYNQKVWNRSTAIITPFWSTYKLFF